MCLLIQKNGHDISTIDEWFRFAPPKKGWRQWVDGRSAKELAKSFLVDGTPAVPPELRALLSSHPTLASIDLTVAVPEHKIPLDRFPGETRNADLAAVGNAPVGKISVTIEAKADESFGNTIGATLAAATPKSNVPRRIASLANALLRHEYPEIGSLRYQLLHGTAASLIYAREQGAVAAVFIVYEFHGRSCKQENLDRNSRDFELFIKTLSPNTPSPMVGNLVGPVDVPGGGFIPAGIPLYLGKAIRLILPRR